MEKTYLFYDLETSGLNKAFDQVLQFASIRTDLQLNEISREEIFVRLNDDTIPSPHALLTHGISLETLSEKGMSEYEAMKKIHRLLNEPGTISIGYNSMEFDDEFLRFSFYKNLLPPYTHQYANQCQRMDIYPCVLMYYLFNRAALQWPIIGERVSFKLESLNDANQWTQGKAHDALADVEMTIAVARTLQRSEKMWLYLTGYFDKTKELQRLSNLSIAIPHEKRGYVQALYVQGSLGFAKSFQCPVLLLGQHRVYQNQFILLRLDHERLSDIPEETLFERCWIIRKKIAEPGFLLPLDDHYGRGLSPDRLAMMTDNIAWLTDHPEKLISMTEHYLTEEYPVIESLDPMASLYQAGFPSEGDKERARRFHDQPLKEQLNTLELFNQPTLRFLALKILGQTQFEALPETYQTEYRTLLQKMYADEPRIDYRGKPHPTLKETRAVIHSVKVSPERTPEERNQLELLEAYLDRQTQKFSIS